MYLLKFCCRHNMGSSLGLGNKPATDHLPVTIADLNKCFTPQPEYPCGVSGFSRTQLDATASNDWQICLTVESRTSARSFCLSKGTGAHFRPFCGTAVPARSMKRTCVACTESSTELRHPCCVQKLLVRLLCCCLTQVSRAQLRTLGMDTAFSTRTMQTTGRCCSLIVQDNLA